MKADLHIHSNNSDGSDSIEILVQNIKKSGITRNIIPDFYLILQNIHQKVAIKIIDKFKSLNGAFCTTALLLIYSISYSSLSTFKIFYYIIFYHTYDFLSNHTFI